jgi:hypothetical protein
MDAAEALSRIVETDQYVEYPFDDHDFRSICDLPKEAAIAWIEASGVSTSRYQFDPEQRGLMNKGALLVGYDRTYTHGVWIYNHDGIYSLITRPVS